MNAASPTPGKYVVAVSGGVDSMVLLHLLHAQAAERELTLTVAHLDHGIRSDSAEDRQLVQATAKTYNLPFIYKEVALGAGASEAVAREHRYAFLRDVQRAARAQAIITAHHQDDVLETAVINILRGRSRKGLASLDNQVTLRRPLLHVPKAEVVAYAKAHDLSWREDSTNSDESYLRNYVRRRLLTRFAPEDRAQLLQHITDTRRTNRELDALLANQLHLQTQSGTIDRVWFNHLPHVVAREVLATWLRSQQITDFDSKMLERLVVAAKTGRPGNRYNVLADVWLVLSVDRLALQRNER